MYIFYLLIDEVFRFCMVFDRYMVAIQSYFERLIWLRMNRAVFSLVSQNIPRGPEWPREIQLRNDMRSWVNTGI